MSKPPIPITDEMLRAFRDTFRDLWPGLGFPARPEAIKLLSAVLAEAPKSDPSHTDPSGSTVGTVYPWTTYMLEIVLHHRHSLAPFPRASAPAYRGTVESLCKLGILEPIVYMGQPIYTTTRKGKRFVDALLNTPLPGEQE